MQVCKWGNSLAIRLPAAIVEILDLKEGDDVQIRVADDVNFDVARSENVEAILKRLRAYRGRLPADFKFDRLEANERR